MVLVVLGRHGFTARGKTLIQEGFGRHDFTVRKSLSMRCALAPEVAFLLDDLPQPFHRAATSCINTGLALRELVTSSENG